MLASVEPVPHPNAQPVYNTPDWHKWIALAWGLLVTSAFAGLQLNVQPFSAHIDNMQQYLRQVAQLTSLQQHRDQLLEMQPVQAQELMDNRLAEQHNLTHVCSESFREAEYEKIRDWGYPPFFQKHCDFPHCEEWTVHELLDSFRSRGLTGLLQALPCDLWKAIAGRTTWLVGDSQTQYFYRTLRCILREHFLEEKGLQDEPLTTDEAHAQLLKEKVFLDYEGGVGMPICTHFKGDTRVCLVRVNMGPHFAEQYLPQLELFNASVNDFLVYNTGLWHHKREGQYEEIIDNITKLYAAHRYELPVMFWRDNSPQHFDIEYGEFPHPDEVGQKLTFPIECKPFVNLTIDASGQLHGNEEHVRAGGWRNKLSQPLIDKSGMSHIHTWNESALLWRMHTRQENGAIECTHFCGPGPYNLWVYAWLTELQRLAQQGAMPPPTHVPVPHWYQ